MRIREGWDISDTKDVMVGPAEHLQLADDLDHIHGEVQETRTTDPQGRCCVNGAKSGPIPSTSMPRATCLCGAETSSSRWTPSAATIDLFLEPE